MRKILQLTAIGLGMVVLPLTASAQSTAEDISIFLSEPEVSRPRLRHSAQEMSHKVIKFREHLDKAIYSNEPGGLISALADTPEVITKDHPGLVEIGQLVLKFYSGGALDRDGLLSQLQELDTQDDWYAGVFADTALANLHLRRLELLLASRYSQSALERIPQAISPLVSDAQLQLSEQVVMLYTVSADPERMLEAGRTTKRLHSELGLDFNQYELMTNFLLAFNWKRDHEGARAMTELLKDEPRPEGTVDGLAEVYTADMLNETGRFEEALALALAARSSSDPLVQQRSRGEAMIAHAGLGQVREAHREMRALGFRDNAGFTPAADRSEGALHAQALLAAADDRPADGLALMNRRLDLMIGKLRTATAADAAALMANLENSRERQLEREAALQQQAEMRAVQLQQQLRINVMLWMLLGAVGLAFAAFFLFTRYRERKMMQIADLREQALSAEKMKTEFLGVINHELRTPLNGVIGISDALINHSPDATTRAQAQAIQGCGEALFELIESMIDMSTIDGGKLELLPEDTRLSSVLAEEAARWTKAANEKGLAYTQYIAPDLSLPVSADSARVRQCVKILLSNAMRFTHAGQVHLHATAAVEDGQAALKVIVADTGQGISEHVQSRLFKPFLQADSTMTRKYGGAGLSLAIARELSKMMDGDVTVQSTEGRGSEFTLTLRLPLAEAREATRPDPAEVNAAEEATDAAETVEAKPAATETDAAPAPIPAQPAAPAFIDLMVEAPDLHAAPPRPAREGLSGATVLVVEDLESNQDVIRLMIEPEGARCLTALSGAEALGLLEHTAVDAVVMDIRMPGMDGVEATRRIRALPGPVAHVPIIVLTADAGAQTNALAMEAGADLFLTKPVIGKELTEALGFVLSDGWAADRLSA